MFLLFSLECQTKTKEVEFLVHEIHIMNSGRFYCLCHREYINASEFN